MVDPVELEIGKVAEKQFLQLGFSTGFKELLGLNCKLSY